MTEAATMPPADLLTEALRYASLGLRVFPLHSMAGQRCSCGADVCSYAKHPRTRRGFLEATTDEKVIRGWWRTWPSANVGIATGAVSGIWVLDVDPDKGGETSFARLVSAHGMLPATVEAMTGSGGRHVVFRHPGHAVPNSAARLGVGLDVRGDGGYIVAAPSNHKSGLRYEWQPGCAPGEIPLADAPGWLLDLLKPAPAAPRQVPPPVAHQDARVRRYGESALRTAADAIERAPEGQRNQTLNREAFSIGQLVAGGVLSRGAAEVAIASAAERAGLHAGEIAASMRSGLDAGGKQPRGVPADTRAAQGGTAVEANRAPPREPGEDDGEEAAPVRPAALAAYAIPSTIEALRSEPPKREFLFSVASDGAGVLARGQVGLLAARGGTGKSNAIMQCALAVATGGTWFGPGRGWAAKQGRALVLFAEEDQDEVMRRRFYALKAAGIISEEALREVSENLVLMPLRGTGVSLTTEVDGKDALLPMTTRAFEVQAYLDHEAKEGRPFSLVGLDPLSRFAGADVEIDNHAATRFIEVCETFTAKEYGAPNVLLAHHSKKLSVQGADPDSADAIRGASGLVDAVRWAAVMSRKKREDVVRLRVVKTNYAAEPAPLALRRVERCHGMLEAIDPDGFESDDMTQAVDTELQEACLRQLAVEPASGTELSRQLKRNREAVLQACSDLATAGRIGRKGRSWVVV